VPFEAAEQLNGAAHGQTISVADSGRLSADRARRPCRTRLGLPSVLRCGGNLVAGDIPFKAVCPALRAEHESVQGFGNVLFGEVGADSIEALDDVVNPR
jgi:hypothetical protein